jgi:hypothetical protein
LTGASRTDLLPAVVDRGVRQPDNAHLHTRSGTPKIPTIGTAGGSQWSSDSCSYPDRLKHHRVILEYRPCPRSINRRRGPIYHRCTHPCSILHAHKIPAHSATAIRSCEPPQIDYLHRHFNLRYHRIAERDLRSNHCVERTGGSLHARLDS